jgi:hypothetical protein
LCQVGEEVKETVQIGKKGLAAELYDESIIKLVQCLEKYLNHGGDCVER